MEKTGALKLEINRFDGKSNFPLWQARVKDVLTQLRLIDALIYEEMPDTMEERAWRRLQMQAVSTIRLYLADDVVIHVLNETSPTVLWEKLEELYMGKSLTNTLLLWRQFYQLRMTEEQSVQEHLSNFQRILTDLLSVGEKVEEKTRALVLLSSLPHSFESLVTALLVGRSTIKMEEVTAALLQKEVLRRENQASSSGGNSALAASGGAGGRRRSDRGSRGGRSRSKDAGKIRYFRCDELGHRVRDCPQLKDRTRTAAAVAEGSDDGYANDCIMVSDEVAPSSQWVLDSACPFHICCREELVDSLESREDVVHLPDGSSCAIKGIGTVSVKVHDGTVKKLGEVRCIPSFRRNLISLSKLDSNGYTWRAGDGVLKVLRGSRVVLRGKKRGGHYFLTGSPVRGGVPGADRSPVRGGAPVTDGSGTRRETRDDGRRRRKVKFLLPQEVSPSRSQVEVITAQDGDGIERPGSTPMFAHP